MPPNNQGRRNQLQNQGQRNPVSVRNPLRNNAANGVRNPIRNSATTGNNTNTNTLNPTNNANAFAQNNNEVIAIAALIILVLLGGGYEGPLSPDTRKTFEQFLTRIIEKSGTNLKDIIEKANGAV